METNCQNRKYTTEFKIATVEMVLRQEKSQKQKGFHCSSRQRVARLMQ